MSSIKSSPYSLKRQNSERFINFASPPSFSDYIKYSKFPKYRKKDGFIDNQVTDSDSEIPCGQNTYILPQYGTPRLEEAMVKFEEEEMIIRLYNSESDFAIEEISLESEPSTTKNVPLFRSVSEVNQNTYARLDTPVPNTEEFATVDIISLSSELAAEVVSRTPVKRKNNTTNSPMHGGDIVSKSTVHNGNYMAISPILNGNSASSSSVHRENNITNTPMRGGSNVSRSPTYNGNNTPITPMCNKSNESKSSVYSGNNTPKSLMHDENNGTKSPAHSGNNTPNSPLHDENNTHNSPLHNENNGSKSPAHSGNNTPNSPLHDENNTHNSALHEENNGSKSPAHSGHNTSNNSMHDETGGSKSSTNSGNNMTNSPMHGEYDLSKSPGHSGNLTTSKPIHGRNNGLKSPTHSENNMTNNLIHGENNGSKIPVYSATDRSGSPARSKNDTTNSPMYNENNGSKNPVHSTISDNVRTVDDLFSGAENAVQSQSEAAAESQLQSNQNHFKIHRQLKVVEQHRLEKVILTYIPRDIREYVKYGLGINMKSGRFNEREDKLIRLAWDNFVKEYEIEDVQSFLKSLSNKSFPMKYKIRFLRYIAKRLPKRFLGRVYSRFLNLFVPYEKHGKFSTEEDEIILSYVKRDITGWKNLTKASELLGRSKIGVYYRYRSLKNIKSIPRKKRKMKWSLKIVENILQMLFAIYKIKQVDDLKDKNISCRVWKKIGKKLNIDPEELDIFWCYKLYQQLFTTSPIYLSEIRIKLILLFREAKIMCWEEIEWLEVSKQCNELKPLFLYWIFYFMVRRMVPLRKQDSFKSIMKYLVKVQLPILKKKTKYNRRLLRIEYDPVQGARFIDQEAPSQNYTLLRET